MIHCAMFNELTTSPRKRWLPALVVFTEVAILWIPANATSQERSATEACLGGKQMSDIRTFLVQKTVFFSVSPERSRVAFTDELKSSIRAALERVICSSHLPLSAFGKAYVVNTDCVDTNELPMERHRLFSKRTCSNGGSALNFFGSAIYVEDQRDILLLYPNYVGQFTWTNPEGGARETVSAAEVNYFVTTLASYYGYIFGGGFQGRLVRDFVDFFDLAFKRRSEEFERWWNVTDPSERTRSNYTLRPRYPGLGEPLGEVRYERESGSSSAGPSAPSRSYELTVFADRERYLFNALALFTFFREAARQSLTEDEFQWLVDNLPKLAHELTDDTR